MSLNGNTNEATGFLAFVQLVKMTYFRKHNLDQASEMFNNVIQ